jgi:hypothetical protein
MNVQLRNVYSSPGIIRVVKSRRMTWTEHEADMGEMITLYRNLLQLHEETKLTLLTLRNWDTRVCIGFREFGNEHSGPIQGWECFDYLAPRLLNKDPSL